MGEGSAVGFAAKEVTVQSSAELRWLHTRRWAAVVAFWAATVVLVAAVSVAVGWIEARPLALPRLPQLTVGPQPAPEAGPPEVGLTGGATVGFPAEPTSSEQFLDVGGSIVELTLYSAEDRDGATYNIGALQYPDHVDLDDPAVNLIASVSGAAGNVNGRVVSQQLGDYQGAPAVHFVVATDDVTLTARHVLSDRILYAQNVAYLGDTEPEDAAAFFASLRLPGR